MAIKYATIFVLSISSSDFVAKILVFTSSLINAFVKSQPLKYVFDKIYGSVCTIKGMKYAMGT